ncbi:hypothetical protein [Cyclobacterium plantarum]|uniref:hypothetical protein n=1 Tax=Cyclobacterium plantarum TaxID=2716263 RepID=UPI003F705D7C
MHYRNIHIFGLVVFLLILSSCNLDRDRDNTLNNTFEVECQTFSYGDTLFFINEIGTNTINPQGIEGPGLFASLPEGLAIDPRTGVIDINASETGLKYKVSFTQGNNSCHFELTIAGINYLDGLYILDQGDTSILPVFNGSPAALPPCEEDDDDDDDDENDDDDDDDDDDCEFDAEGPGGERLADQGLVIGNGSGVIKLQETLQNNFFGTNPENGIQKDVRLYYRLNDGSMRALNGIDLKFFYYETMEDVPQILIDEIQAKQDQILSTKPFSNNLRTNFNPPRTRRPRPPYLVVVSRFAR